MFWEFGVGTQAYKPKELFKAAHNYRTVTVTDSAKIRSKQPEDQMRTHEKRISQREYEMVIHVLMCFGREQSRRQKL